MRRTALPQILLLAMTLYMAIGSSSFLTNVAKADELYASIRGIVTDTSGGAIPGADLTATDIATNVTQHLVSGSDGSFTFLQLSVGDYTVKAEKAGFQTVTANQIHLEVDQVYKLQVKMIVGAVSQEVVVEANKVQVETTTAQLGVVIDSNQIVNMPLLGRNFVNLQLLEPGVMSGSDHLGIGNQVNYATNGGQTQMNVFLIDGTETNDIALNTPTFVPSPDAIQEFRMVTSTLNPEFARSSAAILNVVMKSGTNSFHGDIFDFYRDTFLNARNYFATAPQPYQQNIFGATLGGPVIKKRTFFFFSYQGQRASQPQTGNGVNGGVETTTVYTPAQIAGHFGAGAFAASAKKSPFPLWGDPCPTTGPKCPAGTPYNTLFASGNVPTQDFNSLSQSLVNKYVPLPNRGSNQYSFNATQRVPQDQYLARIDQTFAHDRLWGTWFQEYSPVLSTVPYLGATLPGFAEADQAHYKFLTLSWTHILNDHILNELRGGYNRLNFAAVFPANPTLPSSAGFSINPQLTSGAALPVINITGYFNLGFSSDGPQPRIDSVYEAVDNLSLIEGRHALKFGFDMRRWELYNPFSFQNDGQYNFSSVGTYSTGNPSVDFLLGIPAFYGQGSGEQQDNRARQYYSYVQDEFKLRSNLTLTYGLGWTIDSPMINIAYDGHAQVAFRPNQQSAVFPNAPVGVVYQGDRGVHAAGSTKVFKDFGPRLGFAYSPDWGRLTGGAGKTSIRGGFGIYYDRSEQEQDLQVVGMPPFAINTVLGALGGTVSGGINPSFANPFVDISTGKSVANPFPFAGPSPGTQFTAAAGYLPVFTGCCAVLDANTQDPMAENYNLTLERQLSSDMILSVGYVGSVAHHLSYGIPQNIANSSSTFLYNPDIYGSIDTIFSGANSNYNALQISLNKHLGKGLQFLTAYTYSHSIDEASGFENSTFGGSGAGFGGFGAIRASNPYCFPQCDYGSSSYDARHRLVISYFYAIPGIHGSGLLSRATNGWTISGITTFQTGFPLDVVDGSLPSGGYLASASDFSSWEGPNQVAPVKYYNPRTTLSSGSPIWFSSSSFAPVTPNGNPTSVLSYGDAQRNPLRGPGVNNWDFELYKDTSIRESMRVETRIEFYNVFNHTQFDPSGVITDISSPAFGDILKARNPREIQLAAKFYF